MRLDTLAAQHSPTNRVVPVTRTRFCRCLDDTCYNAVEKTKQTVQARYQLSRGNN